MNFFNIIGLLAFFYYLFAALFLRFYDCNFQLAFFEKFGKKLVNFKRKVVWITDASTELGKIMALKIVRNHGKLVLTSKSTKDIKAFKCFCLNYFPFLKSDDIFIMKFDINALECHEKCFKTIIRYFGKLDILIINNDVKQKGSWENIRLEEELLLFHSNVFSIISLSRLIMKYFNTLKKGKLAILSSVAALLGIPYSSSYSATKHALHGYYRCLKIEKLGLSNVRTTLLCPGSNKFSRNRLINFSKLSETEQVPQNHNKKTLKKEMTVERCAYLCLIAIINGLDEAWIAPFPTLFLIYGMKFYPNVTKYVLNYLKASK